MAGRVGVDQPHRLFFYGTLTHEYDNPVTRAVLPLLRCLGRAETLGTLHAIPDPGGLYPGLTRGERPERGWLYQAGALFDHAALRKLDRWELFDPLKPASSEFVRRNLCVRLGHQTLIAQAYCYNRPVHPGLRRVPSGDFAAFMGSRPAKAFGSSSPQSCCASLLSCT